MNRFVFIACAGILAACPTWAQEVSHFSFNVGAGFTNPVFDAGNNLDMGWNVRGGAGVNFNGYLGLMVNAGYDRMGINSTTLSNVGVPGGNVSVFSATLDPVIHLNPHGHVDVYITGGGGLFHRTQQFTAPTLAAVTGFNPFFGFFSAAVPATQILSSYTVNKPGIDAGMGIAFGSKWHGKFFAEARFDRIFMGNNQYTDYISVTFGFRF